MLRVTQLPARYRNINGQNLFRTDCSAVSLPIDLSPNSIFPAKHHVSCGTRHIYIVFSWNISEHNNVNQQQINTSSHQFRTAFVFLSSTDHHSPSKTKSTLRFEHTHLCCVVLHSRLSLRRSWVVVRTRRER